MALKQTTAGVEKFVRGLWDKGLTDENGQKRPGDEEIVFTEQFYPTTDLSNEFEGRRSEIERGLPAGKKMQTLHLFYAPTKEKIPQLLSQGFFKTMGASKIAFSKDPIQAIKEGFGNTNKLFVVRTALGIEGRDYSVIRGKFVIENLKQVLTAYVITFARPGEAVSVQPTMVFPERQQQQDFVADDEALVFEEAKVVHYAQDDPNQQDVFGNQSHALTSEEERILRHMVKKA